ncbi:hypothetical protein [Aquimarina sp. AU474]|uniref:hypothetical protein n=1 Tax=Aquimarina sp. AU474 TaxID=2108529 RepID=UPI000D68C71B|nr:hypothetical protein [Aquimarina sp. AU474]
MIKFWKSLAYTTKFSIIAFIITFVLGLVSIGVLGIALYYAVSFLFISYPSLNDWHGDWVWPAVILAGMTWSFGFVLGGFAWHYLSKSIISKITLRIVYVFILWVWAAFIWHIILSNNLGS